MFLISDGLRRRDPERGSSLLAVMVVMAVVAIATVTIAGATLSAVQITGGTRAATQAEAAAHAGIDHTVAGLAAGECPASTAVAGDGVPVFDAQLYYSLSEASANAADDVWVAGCSANAPDAKRIKIVSTGSAAEGADPGETDENTRTVEAIYGAASAASAVPGSGTSAKYGELPGLGVAVYAHSEAVIAGSGIIEGSVWAGESAVLKGSAQVFGNLNSPSLSTGGSSILHGDLYTDVAPVTSKTQIKGTITQPASNVPGWADVGFDPSAWPDFNVLTTSTVCDFVSIQTAVRQPEASNGLIIDARNCVNGVSLNVNTLVLQLPADLVIYASKFQFGLDAQIAAPAGSDRKLWFITPDDLADAQPTCTAGNDSTLNQSFIVQSTVSAVLYTPCSMALGFSAQWNGQVYAGQFAARGSSQVHGAPIGLPGADLSGGGSASSGSLVGERLSLRDLRPGA